MAEPARRVIEGHDLYSTHLKEERTIKVFLPPGYEADGAYPVLFCHDGSEFFTHGRAATIAKRMIEEGELEPIIIAALAVNKEQRTNDYDPAGRRHDEYVKFVLDEAVPFVDGHYATSKDSQKRFMAGISLGASCTMDIHLRHPDAFSNLLLFSGAFYPREQERIQQVAKLSGLNAYMVVGRQETAVETSNKETHDFYHYNQHVRDLLRLRGADIHYHEADGTHIWGFWQAQLPDALRWVNQQL
jgi:enterochelin esterase-like enzyme